MGFVTAQAFKDISRGGFPVFLAGEQIHSVSDSENVSDALAKQYWCRDNDHASLSDYNGASVIHLFSELHRHVSMTLLNNNVCNFDSDDTLDAACILCSLVSQSTFNLLTMHVQQFVNREAANKSTRDLWCSPSRTASGDTNCCIKINLKELLDGASGGSACVNTINNDPLSAERRFCVVASMQFELKDMTTQQHTASDAIMASPTSIATFTACHAFDISCSALQNPQLMQTDLDLMKRGKWSDSGARSLSFSNFDIAPTARSMKSLLLLIRSFQRTGTDMNHTNSSLQKLDP